ncbi:hypothetical protein BDN72DRAFT_848530, partial [Pluteus cervinus]
MAMPASASTFSLSLSLWISCSCSREGSLEEPPRRLRLGARLAFPPLEIPFGLPRTLGGGERLPRDEPPNNDDVVDGFLFNGDINSHQNYNDQLTAQRLEY